ncbi:AMP-binding protein [Reyranella sp.]|uniref:AMP-binding protein n=1 Tax=Reyranella sp. TaxID=1929291 RepID=UPI003BACB23D
MPTFREARDFLLTHRTDYDKAVAGFRWPEPVPYNWAIEWFDAELATASRDQCALWIVDVASGRETRLTFGELSRRSNQVANWLRGRGLGRGDHLLLVLNNVAPLWEIMLAAMKLGVIVIPATTLLTTEELADRVERGRARMIITDQDQVAKCAELPRDGVTFVTISDPAPAGWLSLTEAYQGPADFKPDRQTRADDPLLLYFTSGTTAKPKLVRHSHRSYPVGSLSTMYWLGLQPGDVHLNISSPGWAKHAWSTFFAPWNAGATVLIVNQAPFNAKALLGVLERCKVTTFCAPPTVWRLLIQEDLAATRVALREVCGAGEPLNPEVINKVQEAWGLTIRDGYGQTETTAQIANSPGQPVKPGAMGRPMPGYRIRVLDPDGMPTDEGEICIDLNEEKPAGLMQGYADDSGKLSGVNDAVYRTGDVASLDADGYLTFVGRADDVFKSSDYRISPFELESVLIEHEAVAEAAIVPTPDDIRLSIPKAYVLLTAGTPPSKETARAILEYTHQRLAPFKRIRRLEFVTELPKTISGKIRRNQLRRVEYQGSSADVVRGVEFNEKDVLG